MLSCHICLSDETLFFQHTLETQIDHFKFTIPAWCMHLFEAVIAVIACELTNPYILYI